MKTALSYAILALGLTIRVTATASIHPPVNDTRITILLVKHAGITNSDVTARVNFLQDTWNRTKLGTTISNSVPNPIKLTFANGGVAIPYVDPIGGTLTGTSNNQLNKLKAFALQPVNLLDPTSLTVRDFYAADIIIGITPTISNSGSTACGEAPMQYWLSTTPAFVPVVAEGGLDLRGRLTDFVAIVAANSSCGLQVLTHEFGHLFGAGHFPSSHDGLKPSSHAWGSRFKFSG